ncbi:unnamed protein product [Arctogadus glacialis]
MEEPHKRRKQGLERQLGDIRLARQGTDDAWRGPGGPAKIPQRRQSPRPPQQKRKMSRKRQSHRCPPSPEYQKVHQQMGLQEAEVRKWQAGQDADGESPK